MVGVDGAAKLLVDIPNKVRDILGIVVAVNLHTQAGLDWLEIVVDAYASPISYGGEYHLRSGSIKQELLGTALDILPSIGINSHVYVTLRILWYRLL